MLYRLEIENFYSVRDPQVVDLRVSRGLTEAPERFAPVFAGSLDRVPTVVTLFGANGSGKSTVLKALAFLSWFIQGSFHHKGPNLPCERFNDAASATRPVRLAVECAGFTPLTFAALNAADTESTSTFGTFRYELELLPVNGKVGVVKHEALRMRRQGEGKWQRVFERDANASLLGSKTFPLTRFSQVIDKVKPGASAIATLAEFEHEASKVLVQFARSVWSNILIDRVEPPDDMVIQTLARDPALVDALNRELRRIDVGVESMRIETALSGPIALFRHRGLDADMPWMLESNGTRSFIRIFPMIIHVLAHGGIAVIDELDLSIHPLLLPEVIRWFHDPERNKRDGQLWMSSHAASLLDEMLKEEVVLCEKGADGRSRVYSLMDVAAIRRSDNLYRKYLGGVYGAVPHIG